MQGKMVIQCGMRDACLEDRKICSEIKTQNRNDLDNHPTYGYHILELTVLTRPLEEGV